MDLIRNEVGDNMTWKGERTRHSLAARGISTKIMKTKGTRGKLEYEGAYAARYLAAYAKLNMERPLDTAIEYTKLLGMNPDDMTLNQIKSETLKEATKEMHEYAKKKGVNKLYWGVYEGSYVSDEQVYDENKRLSRKVVANQVEKRLEELFGDKKDVQYMYCVTTHWGDADTWKNVYIVVYSQYKQDVKTDKISNEFWYHNPDKFDLGSGVSHTGHRPREFTWKDI